MTCKFTLTKDARLRIVPEQRAIGVADKYGNVKTQVIARMEIVTEKPEQVCGVTYVLLDSEAYDAFLDLLCRHDLLMNYGGSPVSNLPKLKTRSYGGEGIA